MSAINVKIPFAVLPYQNNQLPGPMNEQDVPLEKPASKKKRSKNNNNNNNIETFRTSLFPLPTQAPSGFEGEVEYPTGRGYEGPFVDDSKTQAGISQYGPEKALFHIPDNRQINIKPAEDTWLSRLIGPSQDELDAEANGLRWHWALEHRFMPPGSRWNETVWNGVDRENKWLAQLLRQKNGLDNNMMTPMAKERQRNTLTNQWSKFISSVKNGNFDAYGGTTETAQKWADDFKKYFDSVLGEGASMGLEPVPDILGKRAVLERKTSSDALNVLNKVQNFDERIQDWIANGDFQNPTTARLIRNELDKLAQNFSATLGGDSKNMSEEEKKRIQILYLPESAMANVHETVRRWRKFLYDIMNSASAKEWSQSNRGKLKEMKAALDAIPEDVDESNRGGLGDMAATMGTFVTKALADKAELPHDVAAALEAGKKLYDTYMQNMVLAANVDPAVAHHMAKYIHDEVAGFYNRYNELNRRPERWDYKFSDMDYAALAKEIPADKLLDPVNFKAPVVLGPVTGGDASSNPASKGENKTVKVSANRGKVSRGTSGRGGF